MKKHVFLKVGFVLLTLSMLIWPNDAYQAASQGLNLWFNIVFPSLLPFFICIDILLHLNLLNVFSILFRPLMERLFRLPGICSFAFMMSIFSGYPVGSKITADLVRTNQISRDNGQKLLSLASTSGPLFILSAVAVGILKVPQYGHLLLICHILSAVSIGLVLRFYRGGEKTLNNIDSRDLSTSSGNILGDAVANSISTLLAVGGYIVLFSVIAKIVLKLGVLKLLSNFFGEAVGPVVVGMLEVTNGVQLLAQTTISLTTKLVLVSFLLGFAGISINMQVYHVIYGANLNFGFYLLMKITQGLFSACYCFFGLNFYNHLPVSAPAISLPVFRFIPVLTVNTKIALLFIVLIVLANAAIVFRKRD